MVVKVYISGISGNKEVKKRQQRVILILESKNVEYEVIDIAEPGSEEKKEFMQSKATANGGTISDPNPRHPLPPQIFNEDEYCGDYDMFDMANEIDEMEKFLKLAPDDTAPTQTSNAEVKLGNGDVHNDVPEAAKDEEKPQDGGGDDAEEKDDTKTEKNGTASEKAPSVEKETPADEPETKAAEEEPSKDEDVKEDAKADVKEDTKADAEEEDEDEEAEDE